MPTTAETNCGEILWPFGKFAGQPLGTINSGYLEFVLSNFDHPPALRADVEDELRRREEARRRAPAAKLIRLWKNTMLRRHGDAPDARRLVEEGAALWKELTGL